MVMETLAIANGLLVTGIGVIALVFFDPPSGPVLAVGCWIAAAVLFGIAGKLRSGTEYE
jgi:hypothetical protein